NLKAWFRGRRQDNGLPPANTGVIVTLVRAPAPGDNKRKDLLERPLQKATDDQGVVAVDLPLPSTKVPPGKADLEIQIPDGRKDEKVTQSVDILPEWKVDFFPESGVLVAGVANRVYCQVAAPPAEAADLKGELVDAGGKVLATVTLTKELPRPNTGYFGGRF